MSKKSKKEKVIIKDGKFLRVIDDGLRMVTAHHLSPTRYAIRQAKGNSTVLMVTDMAAGTNGMGKHLLRFDKPHLRGATYPHMNINPRITGVPDPHTPISPGVLKTMGAVGKVANAMQKANKVLFPLAVALDTYRIGRAVYQDSKANVLTTNPVKTVKTVSSVAGGWTGGIAGGIGGSQAGAAIGGSIGACFGGVGAVPGAAIGCLVGGLLGALGLGYGGAVAGEAIAGKIMEANEESNDPEIILVTIAKSEELFIQFLTSEGEEEQQSLLVTDFQMFLDDFPLILTNPNTTLIFLVTTKFKHPEFKDIQEFRNVLIKRFSSVNLQFLEDDNVLANEDKIDDYVN